MVRHVRETFYLIFYFFLINYKSILILHIIVRKDFLIGELS